jgi:hypothetical protein
MEKDESSRRPVIGKDVMCLETNLDYSFRDTQRKSKMVSTTRRASLASLEGLLCAYSTVWSCTTDAD